jgi:hypothetical protein
MQGNVWAPDTYSLGPALAALAAADDAAVILDSVVTNPHSLRQTRLVSCLETMLTLTKLAGAMSKEAAGKGVSSQSGPQEMQGSNVASKCSTKVLLRSAMQSALPKLESN